MDPWFRDLPLDFTRAETRDAEEVLRVGYPMNVALLTLAQNAGLNIGAINQMQAVDFLARDILASARLSDRLPQLMAEVLADPQHEAFHQKVLDLFASHEQELVDAGVSRKPSIARLAAMPTTAEVWHPGEPAPRPLTERAAFEKTINAAAGFADVAVFRSRLAEAEVRTGRVEIGGKARGTGFLIGASLLLTNWHVVAGAGTGDVQFDAKLPAAGGRTDEGRTVRFADDWLVATSPHHEESVELSDDGPPKDAWDYAIVRLAEPVGIQTIGPDPVAVGDPRGHYVLHSEEYAFDSDEPLLIVGHPDGRPMQLSYASPSEVTLTKTAARVRYHTNTEGGSSGSPVFNKDWRVVALHQAAGPTSQSGAFNRQTDDFNQGVPVSGIVASLRALLGDELPAELGMG